MANKTIALTSELYSGTVGMKLYLLNPTTGAIGNGAGDALTEGANGLFTATVTEAITGWWRVLVTDASDVGLIEGGWVYIASDTASTFTVDDPSVLFNQTLDIQSRIPASLDSGNMRSSVQSMAANVLTASALASDAVSEIQSGLATTVAVAAAFTEIKGAGWSSSTDTLEKISDSSGSSVIITPLSATEEQRVNGTTISLFLGENIAVGPIAVTDSNGNAVDLSATCEIVISRKFRGDILIIPDSSITRSGVGNNQFTFPSTGATLIVGTHAWALRRVSDNYVYAYGDWIVKQAAIKD